MRLGLLCAALAMVVCAIMLAGFWTLWPVQVESGLGWLLYGLVPVVVLASFLSGFLVGHGVERRLAALAEDKVPAEGWGADPLGMDAALAEMTARFRQSLARAEERARAMGVNVERAAHMGCAQRDLRDGKVHWSDEFHAILGLEPGGCDPSFEVFLAAVHPGDRAEMAQILRQAAEQGQSREADFRVVRPDGEVRMVHGLAQVTLGEDGMPDRMLSYLHDITDRKRLENELDGLIRELWRSNEELEQFAYVASHDLRQPLRVVGSYVALLEEELMGSLGGDALEYMGFVRDGVRRMDRLITDLLTYSRVGRVISDEPFAVAEAIDSALSDLLVEIEDTDARLIVDDRLPTIHGDRGEVERLFLNLIGNAIKYRRPDEQPHVAIECEDMGHEWLFRVRDNGIGIPVQHAERVFGIFQRLHARGEYEGTGVGLAICKKIVERRGGAIRVEPMAGTGTAIAFTWPKGPADGGAAKG